MGAPRRAPPRAREHGVAAIDHDDRNAGAEEIRADVLADVAVAADDDVVLERFDSLPHAPLLHEFTQFSGDDRAEELGRGDRDGRDAAERQHHREHVTGDRERRLSP